MAISLSHFPISSLLLLALALFAEAAVVTYDFNITWVNANPDGAVNRPTIGINGKWPLPVMYAEKGDNVIVNVDNQLGNQSTTLHFHGLFQNGTTSMDGPRQATQCGIPAGHQLTYNFTVSRLSESMGCTDYGRLIKRVLTGIILTIKDNIQMDFELHLSSATRISHTKTKLTKNSYCLSPIGITTKWPL